MDRILFLDDEQFVLNALKRTFELEGFEVVTTTRPSEALELLRQGAEFQVIGSDYRMPEMSGAEFLQRAREISPHSHRLLISAIEEFSIAVEAVNRGEIHRLIPKPWDRAELISLVRSAAEDYHLRERYQEMTTLLHAKNADLEAVNRDLENRVSASTRGLLIALGAALDLRRAHGDHSRASSLRARRLGEELGFSRAELLAVEQAGLVHDIGLITVPDSILQKPGPLTSSEWAMVHRHPYEGYRILEHVPFLRDARRLVLLHHEFWDGSGYPFGLKERQIPQAASTLAVAESYSALREARSHRPALDEHLAREQIAQSAGKRFEPEVVEAFLRIPRMELEPVLTTPPNGTPRDEGSLFEELRRRALTGEL